MKKTNAMIAAGAALFLTLTAASAQAEVVNIGNEELKNVLKQGTPLIDLRTVSEWQQTGVVEGSQLIMLYDERGRADAEQWLKQVELVADPAKPIALICRTGNRTGKAAQILAQKYPNRTIYNVRDGITGWARASQPVVSVQQNIAHAGIKCSPTC